MKYLLVILMLLTTPAWAQNRVAAAASQTTNSGLPCDPLKLLPGCTPVGGLKLPFDPLGLNPSVAGSISGTPDQVSSQINTVWQQIKAATAADLNYALALAKNANTPGSNIRATCYAAIIVANDQANGTALKNSDGSPMTQPDPSVISHIEQVAELMDSLSATAPLMIACAPAANAVRQNALQFIGTILSAVAIKGAAGGLLP